MAELKRDFSGAKMNKDMDERVLPPGQYRDAKNIQIATSDGSNVGSLQTLLGNTKVTGNIVNDDYSSCVGVLPVPEKDLIYYFVAAGGTKHFRPLKRKDYIIEYDTTNQTTKYVFVDIYSVTHTIAADVSNQLYFDITTGSNHNDLGIRPGMVLSGNLNDPNSSSVNQVGVNRNFDVKVTDIQFTGMTGNARTYRIYHSGSSGLIGYGGGFNATQGDVVTFTADRVLKFQYYRMITAINHLDGMIFWTDNYNEPRKIHIERSKLGTCGTLPLAGHIDGNLWTAQAANVNSVPQPIHQNNDSFHTRLLRKKLDVANAFEVCLDRQETQPIFVEEADITVIKRNPLCTLSVKMNTTEASRNDPNGDANQVFSLVNLDLGDGTSPDPQHLEVGEQITFNTLSAVDYRSGDTIMLTSNLNLPEDNFAEDKAEARIKLISSPVTSSSTVPSTGPFVAEISSIDVDAPVTASDFHSRLEQVKPLFEFKFVRFSYRYKYSDGEYSTFAPWSEIAFLPGDFDYLPKKGFNLGMTNRARYICLKDYFKEFSLVPDDIVEVDLLYKETQSTTVYSVKTITRRDGHPLWPDQKASAANRGIFELDTELIHAVIPSNQLLRPYDNVPKCAKAQEITANRLVYGNYKQNYNIDPTLKLNVQHSAYTIPPSGLEDYEIPIKSLKSMRTYQVGVVWMDEYGRESPVMVPATGGSITVPKKDAQFQNRIKAKILEAHNGGGEPPPWAKFLKYYIKETSNEYYNLAMDRFYDAEDGNVWISFPSAERNKVQEDTYLILKKQHNSNTPVVEQARYRVIAISNEAPLFIKKTRRSFTMQAVEYRANGLPEQGRTFVIVATNDFNSTFGSLVTPEVKPNLQVRIGGIDGGTPIISDIYDVTGISQDNTNTRIQITRPLTSEVSAIAGLNRVTEMRIEMFENTFENRPEFDGRFFVKIFKDLTLQNELLSNFNQRTEYIVNDVMQLGYMSDHNASGEDFFFDWREWHNQNQRTVRSRWFIDDQDCGGSGNSGIQSTDINRGGIYNALANFPNNALCDDGGQFNGIGTPTATGNGYIDLSYSSFSGSTPSSEGDRFSIPYGRLSTMGTLFRFAQDPAQVVFRIIGAQGRLDSSLYEGEGAALFTRTRNAPSGWESEEGVTTGCLIGSNSDYRWNYKGGSHPDKDNRRWSMRIKVDKQFGSGPNHIFQDGMAPMTKPDPTDPDAPRIPVEVGDRYDGAEVATPAGGVDVVNGAGSTVNMQTAVGHFHNWYPITSDTGLELNAANQLVPAARFGNSSQGQFGGFTQYHPQQYSSLSTNHSYGLGPQPGSGNHPASCTIEFLEPAIITDEDGSLGGFTSNNPAIWETEPKEDIGLDIYYEASGAIPIKPDATTNELILPLGSVMTWPPASQANSANYTVTSVTVYPNHPEVHKVTFDQNLQVAFPQGHYAFFERYDGSKICLIANGPTGHGAVGTNFIYFIMGDNAIDLQTFVSKADAAPHHNPLVLGWHNCYSFGNGVESDRIRDDFNAKRLDNGVKASTTLSEPYAEEHRKTGFIWSGIYNSISGVNDLNQFIQAEPITKNLNPDNGSIQKMVARDTNTLAFCEDKVLKILTNKDALFNADGNTNVTSTNNVLGQAVPLPGEYGISTFPESLTSDPDGFYWADVMRGNVLTLRGDQIVSISDMGMKDYFNDNLKDLEAVVGSYDEKKKEYNLALCKKSDPFQYRYSGVTLSYSQKSEGWISFKDFLPEAGLSMNNEYYTFRHGSLWKHHSNETRNNFYGTQYTSDVTLIFNDMPGSVKSFGNINYEGTAAAVTAFTTQSATNAAGTTANYTDGQYYTLFAKTGWYVEDIVTNLQDTGLLEFKNKEGKYFSTIRGKTTELSNLDEREFSVQGLGFVDGIGTSGEFGGATYKIYIQGVHSNDAGNGPASSSHSSWDSTSDDPNWRVLFKQPLNGVDGATIAAGSRESYITNEQSFNGSQWVVGYSGLNLRAQDFSVPGGTASTSGTGNATKYIYTKPTSGTWNADSDITKVEFSNVNIDASFNETPGIPGDPANRIKIETFYQQFTMPSGNKVLKHDVDFNGQSPPTGGRLRDVCVRVSYNEIPSGSVTSGNDRVTITHTDLSDFTETADANYAPDPITTIKHTGTVTQGQTTKVAEYTVEADTNYYLTHVGSSQPTGCQAVWFQRLVNAPWSSAYTFNYINTFGTGVNSSKIIKTVVEIFYTPPTGVGWEAGDPDSPEGDFCAFLHEIRLDYLARPLGSINPTPKTHTISFPQSKVTSGDKATINILSNDGGNIGLVVKKVGEGDNLKYATLSGSMPSSSINSTSNVGEYVWSTNWTTTSTPIVNTIALVAKNKGVTSVGNSNEIDIQLDGDASATEQLYHVYGTQLSGDNAATLDTNFPSSSSPLIIKSQSLVRQNLTCELPTGVTAVTGSAMVINDIFVNERNIAKGNINQNVLVYFKLQCSEGSVFSISRQPTEIDIYGAQFTTTITQAASSGATTVLINQSDVGGVAVGMTVTGDGVADNTTITNISTRTLTLSNGLTSALSSGSSLRFSNGFTVLADLTATKISNTRADISGSFTLSSTGSTGGNLTIKTGNFLTII